MNFQTFCILFLVAVSGAIATVYFLTIVQYDGTLTVNRAGRSNTIKIYRDEYGIPRIYADTYEDTLYGLGWAHAQDRLWSLHLRRMLFSGRLSEMFGNGVLRVDKYMRTIGLLRGARNNLKHLDPQTLARLQAYADGINDYVNSIKILPFEFVITRTNFEKWEPVDSIVYHRFMSFSLTHDWMTQLFRTRLATLFGKERACEILACSSEYPYNPDSVILNDDELKQSGLYEPAVVRDVFSQLETENLEEIFSQVSDDGNLDKPKKKFYSNNLERTYFNKVNDLMASAKGSNSWVISGQHTASGRPLLANDPHLDNSMPSSWTQAELVWNNGKRKIIGATIPGVPYVAIGRTESISWGLTTLYSDSSDVYLEKLNQAGDKYFFEGKWYDIIRHEEMIKVRGSGEVLFVVNATRHGPIMTDLMDNFHPNLGAPHKLKGEFSFAWVGHVEEDHSISAIFNIMNLTSIEDLKKDNSRILNPSQNVVLSFASGDIAYMAIGLLPIRRSQFDGAFVKDGTQASNEWLGYASKWENPHVFNPKKGYIITANNKFATDNMKHQLSRTQHTTARAARIQELIEAQINKGRKFSPEDMKRFQLDTVDVYARDNVNRVLKIVDRYKDEILGYTNSNLETVTQQLDGWRGSFDKESIGASVFSVWEFLFNQKLFQKTGLDEGERMALFSNNYYDNFFFRSIVQWSEGQNLNASYCVNDDNRDQTDKPCVWNVVMAMCETYNYLHNLFGGEPSRWKWGDLHHMNYNHAPFSSSFFRLIYHRSKPAAGNKRTVNVASYFPRHYNFDAMVSANLRIVNSWASPNENFFIIDTGMTEGPFTGHYDDQMKLILNGEYLSMAFTKEDQHARMKHKLELNFQKPSKDAGKDSEL